MIMISINSSSIYYIFQLLIFITLPEMEDSMELPGQQEANQEINFFVSPNNSLKKKQCLINTGSQQSLAYSSETHTKYHNVERSPDEIQIPNFEMSEKPLKIHKFSNTGKISTASLVNGTQSEFNLLSEGFSQQQYIQKKDRRKTINRNEYHMLSKKNKQLEYALHIQIMSGEELRTKVAILKQLLEKKIKESEISELLKMRNTSKNLKNIDIFVEFKQNQKKLKETLLIIQQQKQQIEKLNQVQSYKENKENFNTENYMHNNAQIQGLVEEKQSLFAYIEQLKKQYSYKQKQTEQAMHELQKQQQKQQRFVSTEKPKLLQQLSQKSLLIKELKQEVEQLKMQKNLMELNYQNQIQELKNYEQRESCKITEENKDIMNVEFQRKEVQQQTDLVESQQILKAELKILKSERDYYITEYKKKLSESSQNYLLKLQLKNYQQQLNVKNQCC